MEHHEGTFAGTGGLELYYQRWRGSEKAHGALAVVHGLGEHSGRYMNLVDRLVPAGWTVYGFDHRGFGRSPGQRGHINAWSEYRGDVDAFLRLIGGEENGLPLVLMGHSMGGLVVLDYVLREPRGIVGTIVSAPGLRPVGVAKPHLVFLAKLLSKIWPRFSLDVGLDAEAVSRDPEVVRAFVDDPLRHSRGTARWGTESLRTIGWIWKHPHALTLPILMVQGGDDRLVAADGTRDFFARLTQSDKELHVFEGGFHEPHNDINHEEASGIVLDWLERHV